MLLRWPLFHHHHNHHHSSKPKRNEASPSLPYSRTFIRTYMASRRSCLHWEESNKGFTPADLHSAEIHQSGEKMINCGQRLVSISSTKGFPGI